MVFLVVMYGCDSWTIKKAECWRIDDFQQWCWRRLLSPLDSKEIKPVLKEINLEYTLEGLVVKIQYSGHLIQRVDSWGNNLMLEKIEGKRRKCQRMRWLDGITDSTLRTWVWVDSRSWWWTGRPGVLWFMGSQRVGHDWATELNWTEGKRSNWAILSPF